MKSLRVLIVFGLLLLAIPFAAAAQADTQTVDLGDGYQITVPADWDVTRLFEGAYMMGDDALMLTVNTPIRLDRLNFDLTDSADALDALATISVSFSGEFLARADFDEMVIGDRLMAGYTNAAGDQIRFAVPLSDGQFGYLKIAGSQEDAAAFSEQMDSIIASFDVNGALAAASVNAGTGVACTVSASADNESQLRVGPGENRSAIAFLPTNTDVTVTGRTELDDGSVWFQLDKAEAAPQGTAAAELWVNEDLVETSGDCDQVGETNAPPVIPISVAPPPGATAAPGEPASGQQEGCDLAWFTFADGVMAGITSLDYNAVQSQRQTIESSPYPACASRAREIALNAYHAALLSIDAFNYGNSYYASIFRSQMHDFLDLFAIEEYSLGAY